MRVVLSDARVFEGENIAVIVVFKVNTISASGSSTVVFVGKSVSDEEIEKYRKQYYFVTQPHTAFINLNDIAFLQEFHH